MISTREQPPFEEPLSPIGRMQSGLAALFATPSLKRNNGDGNQFGNDKPFIDERKPMSTMIASTTIARSYFNNGEHAVIPVTAKMIHSAVL
jgi:hypothetical protein